MKFKILLYIFYSIFVKPLIKGYCNLTNNASVRSFAILKYKFFLELFSNPSLVIDFPQYQSLCEFIPFYKAQNMLTLLILWVAGPAQNTSVIILHLQVY